MVSKNSPFAELKVRADRIASQLKALERGDTKGIHDPRNALAKAKAAGHIVFAVVMDDKVIKVKMPWEVIRDTDEAGISQWILDYMQGTERKLQ